MNVDKAPFARLKDSQADTGFGLDGSHRDVDRENVLDLLVVIEDERRFHAAAAVLTEDPAECERYRALAREGAALLANIRRGMAHDAKRHLSRRERTRQLERYLGRLMDWSQISVGSHGRSITSMQGDAS